MIIKSAAKYFWSLQLKAEEMRAKKREPVVSSAPIQRYFTTVFYNGILQRYFTTVFYNGILQRYFTTVFYNGILQRVELDNETTSFIPTQLKLKQLKLETSPR